VFYESPPARRSGMPYYESPEKKTQINLRVSRTLKARLEGLVDVWKELAKARGDNPDDIDLTHVATILLRVGSDAAWTELGGFPSTPEQMEAVIKAAGRPIS
jgi:hypothetical protein